MADINQNNIRFVASIVTDDGSKPEVLARIAQTAAAITKLKIVWTDINITLSSKIRLMRSLVMSIFLYACETWTLTAELENIIQSLEMRCYRRLLGVTWKVRISNEEIRSRIRLASGPCNDLLSSVKRLKLKWFDHVARSQGLAKTVLQGTVPGGRRSGRQNKRWEDNIAEWTGLKLSEAMKKSDKREQWRELCGRSVVVPQRSSRLRD